MEDWIILNNNNNNINNNINKNINTDNIQYSNNQEITDTNDLISQLDIEIEKSSYEHNYQSNPYIRAQDKDFIYSSCSYLFNNIQIQLKTIHFYLLSIVNDIKNLLY